MKKDTKKIIADAAAAYAAYMDIILPGWKDDPNSKDTPLRVAKAFVEDIGKSLYTDFPKITTFENVDGYDGIVFQGNIPVKSLCSHHHQNVFGEAFIAYIPDGKNSKIIGLSKLNRVVDFFSRKPQVQENLTMQIHTCIDKLIENNKGVAVVIRAKHMCVSHRGIGHDSDMQTAKLSKYFFDNEMGTRSEFYRMIKNVID